MTEGWIVNASPLILFARIARLDLIESLAVGVVVPASVLEEVRAGRDSDRTVDTALDWALPFCRKDIEVPATVQNWDIGPGESQVLAQCLRTTRWAVLDDRMARRCANAHGIPVIGSLGIVLRAKNRGLIEHAKPWVCKLRDAGMYLDEATIRRVLSTVAE